jgi:hypothetical protein
MRECPACGLQNVASASRCDCGADLAGISVRTRQRASRVSRMLAVVGVVIAGAASWRHTHLLVPFPLVPFLLSYFVLVERPGSGLRAGLLSTANTLAALGYGGLLVDSDLSSTVGLNFLFVPLWHSLWVGATWLVTLRFWTGGRRSQRPLR